MSSFFVLIRWERDSQFMHDEQSNHLVLPYYPLYKNLWLIKANILTDIWGNNLWTINILYTVVEIHFFPLDIYKCWKIPYVWQNISIEMSYFSSFTFTRLCSSKCDDTYLQLTLRYVFLMYIITSGKHIEIPGSCRGATLWDVYLFIIAAMDFCALAQAVMTALKEITLA